MKYLITLAFTISAQLFCTVSYGEDNTALGQLKLNEEAAAAPEKPSPSAVKPSESLYLGACHSLGNSVGNDYIRDYGFSYTYSLSGEIKTKIIPALWDLDTDADTNCMIKRALCTEATYCIALAEREGLDSKWSKDPERSKYIESLNKMNTARLAMEFYYQYRMTLGLCAITKAALVESTVMDGFPVTPIVSQFLAALYDPDYTPPVLDKNTSLQTKVYPLLGGILRIFTDDMAIDSYSATNAMIKASSSELSGSDCSINKMKTVDVGVILRKKLKKD